MVHPRPDVEQFSDPVRSYDAVSTERLVSVTTLPGVTVARFSTREDQ